MFYEATPSSSKRGLCNMKNELLYLKVVSQNRSVCHKSGLTKQMSLSIYIYVSNFQDELKDYGKQQGVCAYFLARYAVSLQNCFFILRESES
jgi:hypothetical protein